MLRLILELIAGLDVSSDSVGSGLNSWHTAQVDEMHGRRTRMHTTVSLRSPLPDCISQHSDPGSTDLLQLALKFDVPPVTTVNDGLRPPVHTLKLQRTVAARLVSSCLRRQFRIRSSDTHRR